MKKIFYIFLVLVWKNLCFGQWSPTTKVTAPIFDIKEVGSKLYACGYGGLYSSSDDGLSWKRIDNSGKPILHDKVIYDLDISASIFYINNQSVLYQSKDFGKTYQNVIGENCLKIAANGSELMLVTLGGAGKHYLRYSNDAGLTWQDLTAKIPPDSRIRQVLFWNNRYILLRESGEIYSTLDKGLTWHKEVLDEAILNTNVSNGKVFAVAVDDIYVLDSSGTVWKRIPLAGTAEYITAVGDTLLAPVNNTTVFRSDDFGKNWYNLFINQHLFWPNRFYKKIFVTSKGTLFAASDLGASYSKDGGYTWTPVNNEGFFLQGCWSVSVAGDNILAGYNNGGNSGVFVSKDNTLTWQGSYPLRQILSTQVTDNTSFLTEGQLYRSLDYGTSWQNLKVDTIFRNYFYLANTEQHLFVTASAVFNEFELYRTNNKGATWTKVNTTGLATQRVNYLASNKNKLFSVVHPSQDLYASNDEGETWKQVTSGEPGFKFFTRVFCFDSLIVVCQSSDIFVSKDNGTTWRSIKNNLLYNYYNITVLYHDHKLLISGEGLPVQLSNEDFTEWYEIDPTGLPFNNDNYGMAIKGQDLYLAQRRNGLFKRNLNEILKVSAIDLSTTIPALFPNPATQVLQVEVGDAATYEIFGIDGRSWVTKSKTSGAIDVSQLPAGTYI